MPSCFCKARGGYGYRDGRAITQVLKRLVQVTEVDKALNVRRKTLQSE